MKITKMFERGTVFSFEIFPPKKTSPVETIYNTLEQLGGLHPDFISVTYGAGGNGSKASTCEIAATIKDKYGIEPVAHLPCINYTKEEIVRILDDFKAHGITNVLALRGDINPDIPPKKDFTPNLKKKVDAGATHLISQLFFDNSYFYSFLEKTRLAGINVPIEAGIMPVVNKKQIERMVTMCGASLPDKFVKTMERYEHSPEALRDAGIAYAVNQIVDLVSHGVDGIHLYTMNNPYVARRISEAVESIIRS